jgi:pentapeptide repeat protein
MKTGKKNTGKKNTGKKNTGKKNTGKKKQESQHVWRSHGITRESFNTGPGEFERSD